MEEVVIKIVLQYEEASRLEQEAEAKPVLQRFGMVTFAKRNSTVKGYIK